MSYSDRVYSPVGMGWHRIRMKLACVNVNNRFTNFSRIPDKSFIDYSLTCEDKRRSNNHIFSNLLQNTLSVSVNGWNLALVDLWKIFATFGRVHPSFNRSFPLLWWKTSLFCIVSSVGTMSLLFYHRRKSLNIHILPWFHISGKFWLFYFPEGGDLESFILDTASSVLNLQLTVFW